MYSLNKCFLCTWHVCTFLHWAFPLKPFHSGNTEDPVLLLYVIGFFFFFYHFYLCKLTLLFKMHKIWWVHISLSVLSYTSSLVYTFWRHTSYAENGDFYIPTSIEDKVFYFFSANIIGERGIKITNLTSLVAQLVKNLLAMQETWVWTLVWENPLEEGMATHSGILAWRIPMDRGVCQSVVCGVMMSWTQLSDYA